jgi:hypothetical protein
MHGTAQRSIYVCHSSDYTFTDWFHHFISSAKLTTQDPVIKIGYDVSRAASGHTQILLPPKLSTLCVICMTTKISYYKVKYDQ